jgi:G3E family GTPase
LFSSLTGSGKTSLLKNFIENRPTGLERAAIILNDSCSGSYDATTLKHNLFLLSPDGGSIEASESSGPRSLRSQILKSLQKAECDHIFIEIEGLGSTSHAINVNATLLQFLRVVEFLLIVLLHLSPSRQWRT